MPNGGKPDEKTCVEPVSGDHPLPFPDPHGCAGRGIAAGTNGRCNAGDGNPDTRAAKRGTAAGTTVAATQETETPTPAPQKEESTAPAENGADENASPASPDEKPTENTPAAPEKNPADEEPGKEAGQNEPTAEGKNEPLALGLDDAGQNAAEGENGEGSGGTHYVAESGGTQYETVQEILDNMEEGEITLLDSVTGRPHRLRRDDHPHERAQHHRQY